MNYAYVSKSDAELRTLAVDTVAGHVFWGWMIPEETGMSPASVFLPIGLSERHQLLALKQAGVSQVYEYVSEAGPISCNGLPSFWTAKFLDRTDWEKIEPMIVKLATQQEEFLNPQAEATS